ncbi:F-box domain containing protein [Tanacetum coccineum]
MRHRFYLGYKTWVHHGEPDLPPPPPVIDNTRQPQMSDMTALLNDLSYIPPNNEYNEPTQGDIGETSNKPNQATRNEFEELYASANEELHPGCDYVTRLDFMAKFTYFKVKGQKFNMRAMVLWTINDFPARSSLSGWSGQAYVGHRRFLKKPHTWRSSREFNGQTDNRDPPKEFGQDEIRAQLDRLPTRLIGGPIRPRWMFPFERYMKKLKGYVQNKAKPEGLIAEFKSLFPNKDMKEEFPEWFGSQIRPTRHVDNDKSPEVSTTSELFRMACGTTWTPKSSINSCVVDGVRVDRTARYPLMLLTKTHDITDDEDSPVTHDLAVFLMMKNSSYVDDDGVDKMLTDPRLVTVGVEDLSTSYTMYPAVVWVALLTETQFDLRPHMESPNGQSHVRASAAFEKRTIPTRLLSRPSIGISIFSFGMITGTLPEPLKIGKTGQRAQSYLDSDLGRLLAFEMRWQSSGTQEYPSLINTFYVAHTVNGEFLQDEDRRIYEEMRRLEATDTYTDDEINRLARRGKQRGHIPGFGRVLPARATAGPSTPVSESADVHEDEDEDGNGDS